MNPEASRSSSSDRFVAIRLPVSRRHLEYGPPAQSAVSYAAPVQAEGGNGASDKVGFAEKKNPCEPRADLTPVVIPCPFANITGCKPVKDANMGMGIIDSYRFVPRDRHNKSRGYEILPDGFFDLSFLLSESACKIILAGPYTKKKIVPLGTYELIIIHFRVGRMPDFANIRAGELVNSMIELPHLRGLDRDAIGEGLLKRNTAALRKTFIEEILGHVNVSLTSSDSIFESAVALIDARDGRIQVEEIARTLAVSNRTLERKFNLFLGFPPKMFIRLVRFQKVLEAVRSNSTSRNLSDIAHEFGYFDQAHFIRDFTAMSGVLPGSFCR